MIKNRNVLTFSILALIIVLVWAGVTALEHFRQSNLPKDIVMVAKPLNPELNLSFFNRLQQKLVEK